MIVSQTAEYALRAVTWLASLDVSQTTQQIAEGTHVPASYLAKVLKFLARAGLVSSQRGLGGGFALARPAAAITALEVINAVDPLKRIETCPLDLAHCEQLCPLHQRIDQAIALVERAFADTTIAALEGTYARRAARSEKAGRTSPSRAAARRSTAR